VEPATVTIKGQLPDGPLDEVTIRIASVMPFPVIKGMGYRSFGRDLKDDFQQPPFYQEYFKKWGLDEAK
jgi:hypothetical protein